MEINGSDVKIETRVLLFRSKKIKIYMKSLKDFILENLTINESNYSKADEKLFWQLIDDMGKTEIFKELKDDDHAISKKLFELGVSEEQFKTFSEIFYDKAGKMLDIIEDDDPDMSDDGCQYASWSAPFYGKDAFEKALKSKDWYSICDEDDGELAGYGMDEWSYGDWLEENEKEDPEGYTGKPKKEETKDSEDPEEEAEGDDGVVYVKRKKLRGSGVTVYKKGDPKKKSVMSVAEFNKLKNKK